MNINDIIIIGLVEKAMAACADWDEFSTFCRGLELAIIRCVLKPNPVPTIENQIS